MMQRKKPKHPIRSDVFGYTPECSPEELNFLRGRLGYAATLIGSGLRAMNCRWCQ
jgi:hypothetical protein